MSIYAVAIDAKSNKEVPFAAVSYNNALLTADSGGNFKLDSIFQEQVVLKIEREGYQMFIDTIDVINQKQDRNFQFFLAKNDSSKRDSNYIKHKEILFTGGIPRNAMASQLPIINPQPIHGCCYRHQPHISNNVAHIQISSYKQAKRMIKSDLARKLTKEEKDDLREMYKKR